MRVQLQPGKRYLQLLHLAGKEGEAAWSSPSETLCVDVPNKVNGHGERGVAMSA